MPQLFYALVFFRFNYCELFLQSAEKIFSQRRKKTGSFPRMGKTHSLHQILPHALFPTAPGKTAISHHWNIRYVPTDDPLHPNGSSTAFQQIIHCHATNRPPLFSGGWNAERTKGNFEAKLPQKGIRFARGKGVFTFRSGARNHPSDCFSRWERTGFTVRTMQVADRKALEKSTHFSRFSHTLPTLLRMLRFQANKVRNILTKHNRKKGCRHGLETCRLADSKQQTMHPETTAEGAPSGKNMRDDIGFSHKICNFATNYTPCHSRENMDRGVQ